MRPKARMAVLKTAADIEATAKTAAPVDTGNLRSSIQHRPTGDLSAEVTVGAEYAMYVEFGTSKMGAQPYLLPAVEHAAPVFQSAIRSLFS
jgi:HK97 gp10 family phage protein